MGREVEAVSHLCWEERWGLSHTCDGESDGGCHIPVMGRTLGLSRICDMETAGDGHTPVMGREIWDVTYL